MRYSLLLSVLPLLFSSCKKNSNNYNPCRAVMLGNYHFTYDSTQHYDGTVTISSPDNGNGINISYPNATAQEALSTNDSSVSSIAWGCPHYGNPLVEGNYQHDTLFLGDISQICDGQPGAHYINTIGVKY